MYKVLDKDIIENEILPDLSVAKRGFKTKSCLIEIVNSILYKLKTGIQWYMLPVGGLFSDIVRTITKSINWYRRLDRRDISIFVKWKKDFIWEQTQLNFTDVSRAMKIVMNSNYSAPP